MDTFLRGKPSYRKRSPVASLEVYIDSRNIGHTSLHVLFEAMELMPTIVFKPDDSIVSYCVTVIRKLAKFSGEDFMRELLPNARGKGKLKSLSLDEDLNLLLRPQLGYLTSFPALDPIVRNALYEFWQTVPVNHVFLQLLPLASDLSKIPRHPDDSQCDRNHPFWQRYPHKSFIHSVRFLGPGLGPGDDFIVHPSRFVLPEGYGFTEIGVNEQELRKQTDAGVWVQLVAPGDDEFHIRIEGPDEYTHEYVDGDFVEEEPDGDGDSDEGDDNGFLEKYEDVSEITHCLEDAKIPLQDLLGDVYPGFRGLL